MTHIHWVGRGTGTPKDRDEVNKREVCVRPISIKCNTYICRLIEIQGNPTVVLFE